MEKKKRLDYIDIAKGIGIILVVWAHARGPFSSYINQFHMPLFFIISGFLYNPKTTLKEFTIKKIQRLYIPFVFWNMLACLLKQLTRGKISSFLQNAWQILLTLNKDGEFFGATWFLGALFTISILYKICDVYIQPSKFKRLFITILFVIGAIIGFEITLPYRLSRTFICGMFFAFGYFVKDNLEAFQMINGRTTACAGLISFILISYYSSANMGANEYSSPILFVIGASMASYFTIYFSAYISKATSVIIKKARWLTTFLGQKSMDILIWQFVSFRLVILLQLYMKCYTNVVTVVANKI